MKSNVYTYIYIREDLKRREGSSRKLFMSNNLKSLKEIMKRKIKVKKQTNRQTDNIYSIVHTCHADGINLFISLR